MAVYPLRRVKVARFIQSRYNRPGSGSWHLLLECGHDEFRKGSALPTQCRCRDCGLGRKVDPNLKKEF